MGSKGFESTFQANIESEVKIDKLEVTNLAKNRLLKNNYFADQHPFIKASEWRLQS